MRNIRKSKNPSCGCFLKQNGHKAFHYNIGENVETAYGSFTIISRFRQLKKNSNSHEKYYDCECNFCHEITTILENVLDTNSGSCHACSKSRSYPNKFVYWFLKQTGIEFVSEYSPEWSGRYRYDFYFKNHDVEYVIEVDGLDHFNEHTRNDKTLEDILKIDRMKDDMAREHQLRMIRLDCRYSNRDYIINSIKKSELSSIFDLSQIDWNKCISSWGGFTP